MANLTVSIPKELCEKMKRHSEVKWSEVVRKALSEYVDRLELVEGGVVPMKTLAKRMKEKGVDVSKIDLEKAIKYYEEGRKARTEEIVYDTSQLIEFSKKGKFNLAGFTTILNVIEYPKAEQFEELTVIYPVFEDYEEALEISQDLLRKGTPLQAVDLMTAAICVRRNLTLSTRDQDFANVKGVRNSFRFELAK